MQYSQRTEGRPGSPADADALALTFAQAVAPVKKPGPLVPIGGDFYCGGEGDGCADGRAQPPAPGS